MNPRDHALKTQLRRLFRPQPPEQPATIDLRLANVEKKLDTLETRVWAMVGAVAAAELLRVLLGK